MDKIGSSVGNSVSLTINNVIQDATGMKKWELLFGTICSTVANFFITYISSFFDFEKWKYADYELY